MPPGLTPKWAIRDGAATMDRRILRLLLPKYRKEVDMHLDTTRMAAYGEGLPNAFGPWPMVQGVLPRAHGRPRLRGDWD